jgi:hypothetical protein
VGSQNLARTNFQVIFCRSFTGAATYGHWDQDGENLQ